MSHFFVSASGDAKSEYPIVRLGMGSYTTQLPLGRNEPQQTIYRTPDLTGPMPTNRWWSSAAWLPLSENMYAHPLVFRATNQGLGVSYPPMRVSGGANPSFHATYRHDLTLGLDGLAVHEAHIAGFSDWTVDLQFASDEKKLLTRIGHGFPYVYGTFQGAAPVVIFPTRLTVWAGDEGSSMLGITVNGNHYGLFCPSPSIWKRQGPYRLRCEGGDDKGYVSIGLLPQADEHILALFAGHAFAYPKDTKVEWAYDPTTSTVTTVYEVEIEAKLGDETRVLMALYPHQWKYSDTSPVPIEYTSPRGAMRLVQGNQFRTHMVYRGILPFMPPLSSHDREVLARELQFVMSAPTLWPPGLGTGEHDTYWLGKALNRVAQLVPIAQQLGDEATSRRLLHELREQLEHWLQADPVRRSQLFYYNANWGTLIGYPASHGTDTDLNDHHFHYGYFIGAAAILALNDPVWAEQGQWGDMVRLLIRDWASPDRNDPQFPFLRTFDPYTGHSWASGTGAMREGNNQESSSEAIHAWASLILFGEAVGDWALRDLGIWGYTQETEAARLYWFDTEDMFPSNYAPPVIGRLYGSGGDYDTWWTRDAGAVHAINFLPITAASLHMGRDVAYVRRNIEWLTAQKGGTGWVDIIQSYRALADPHEAFDTWYPARETEYGESRAHTYHWIKNLQQLGHVKSDVVADHPLYAVFERDGKRTYVAYNAHKHAITVAFSDGTQMNVPAGQMAIKCRTLVD